MKSEKINNNYIIRLDRGEKIIESIKEFCTKKSITLGYFFAIGALDEVELAHYVVETKKYSSKKFNRPLEITNMSGNIATMNNEIYLHCHITLSNEEMNAIAGHLVEGKVAATCEIVLFALKGEINRKYDDFIGLNLLDM